MEAHKVSRLGVMLIPSEPFERNEVTTVSTYEIIGFGGNSTFQNSVVLFMGL